MAADRLTGLDAARGLAILGMMTAHIWITENEKFVDGRSSILFATIAGMSLGLLTQRGATDRTARRAGRMVVLSRAGLLFGLGLILGSLAPPLAVILDDYAVYFLLLLPLLFVPRWVLFLVAAAVAALGPVLVGTARDIADAPGGEPLLYAGEWLVTGVYPAAVFLAFPLLGLICVRSDLRRLSTRLVMIAGGAALCSAGYGAAILIPGVDAAAHSGSTAEILGSGGLAVALVGILLLICDSPWPLARPLRIVLWPLAAAGSMPLTIYTAHVIGMALASASSYLLTGEPFHYAPWLLPLMLIGALAVASAIRATLGSGPLEAGMSRVVSTTSRALTRR